MYLLHYAPDNASLIIRLVLEEMGLPYETALVDRSIRAQDSAAYRAVNPTGLIPALEVPGATLFETAAILLWLSETHGCMAPKPGAADRGDFLKWLIFTSNTLHADLRLHFYPEPHAGSAEGLDAFRAATSARLIRHLGLIEAMMRDHDPAFLQADAPSVLGYYLATACRWLALYPRDRRGWFDLRAFPRLHHLARGLEQRPAALRAALAEGLGPDIFTAPRDAIPPEGAVL